MIFLIFFLACPLLILLVQKWCNNRRKLLPPGPQGLPIIGNLHQLDNSLPLFQQLWQLSQKYGHLMYLQLGFLPVIVVSSAKMAKEVLKTHDVVFSDRPILVGLQKVTYNYQDMAFSTYNEYTKELKKIFVTKLLSSKRVQSFRPVREEEVNIMIEEINKFADDAKTVNLVEIVMSLTSTIICRIAFGKSYNNNELFARNKFCKLLSEGQAAYGEFYVSDYFPYTGWIDKLTGKIDFRDKINEELDAFVEKIIYDHMDDERNVKSGEEDIIDVLLRIQKDGSSTIKLTLEGIKALVLVDIFTAGTDTNASSIVWMMSELMKNPTTMNRLQKDIRVVNPKKIFLNEDDIQNIPYLQAVVKETMRLHPPVPLLVPHKPTEICNLDGYIIQPETLVYVNAWAIGRDPDSWENPEKFMPERFLSNSIDIRGKDFELIPFGAGRRACPGMLMAIATVELALANLVYAFNWELPNGMNEDNIDMDANHGVTVHKKVPLCLVPKKYL